MTWGNHQPRTGLIESAFQRELHRRLKGSDDWCFNSHDESKNARLCTLVNQDGRKVQFNSFYAAAHWLGVTPNAVYKRTTVKGWIVEEK